VSWERVSPPEWRPESEGEDEEVSSASGYREVERMFRRAAKPHRNEQWQPWEVSMSVRREMPKFQAEVAIDREYLCLEHSPNQYKMHHLCFVTISG
jgi:hypothetical protein